MIYLDDRSPMSNTDRLTKLHTTIPVTRHHNTLFFIHQLSFLRLTRLILVKSETWWLPVALESKRSDMFPTRKHDSAAIFSTHREAKIAQSTYIWYFNWTTPNVHLGQLLNVRSDLLLVGLTFYVPQGCVSNVNHLIPWKNNKNIFTWSGHHFRA